MIRLDLQFTVINTTFCFPCFVLLVVRFSLVTLIDSLLLGWCFSLLLVLFSL
jgi:hypothetical protein